MFKKKRLKEKEFIVCDRLPVTYKMVFLATSEPSLIEIPPLGGLKIAFSVLSLLKAPETNQLVRPIISPLLFAYINIKPC
jgi:hypothetical protein